ncbi:MAG: iron ABC transporter permease [Bacteroidales bacterium]|nr:iron ABC transporter permease [Bacteroidales bacterium]
MEIIGIAKGKKSNNLILSLMLLLGIILFFVLNVAVGSVYIPFPEVIKILLGQESENQVWVNIIIKSRLPQAITACLSGSGLAIGGLLMQTLFRNPLAGPSILGISSGASLGVAFVIMFVGNIGGFAFSGIEIIGNLTVVFAAFAGSVLVLLLILFLAQKVKNNAMLLIIGIMIGYISSSLVGVLQFYSISENVHAFAIWGLASFSNISWSQMNVFIPIIFIGLFFSFLLIKPLNMLLLGENYAKNLGLNIKRSRLIIILVTGLLTAVITAFCGPLAFLGLAVPHLARMLYSTSNHKVLVPGVIFFGALLALFCNLIARMPGFDGALPVNAVTSMIGAPIVISVVLKKKKLNSFN